MEDEFDRTEAEDKLDAIFHELMCLHSVSRVPGSPPLPGPPPLLHAGILGVASEIRVPLVEMDCPDPGSPR